MRLLLLLLLICPFKLWAQIDTLGPINPNALKPIESDLIPGYGRYGRGVRTQYIYDGLDVRRVTDLEKYIRASGDVDANAEYDRFKARRQSSWPLIIVGSGAYIGGLIGMANAISSDPNRHTVTYTTSTYPYTRTSSVSDRGAGGAIVALIGVGLAAWGFSLRAPGNHVRRSIQYYNRALKQRSIGVSWQLTPYSSATNSGIGLMGRF